MNLIGKTLDVYESKLYQNTVDLAVLCISWLGAGLACGWQWWQCKMLLVWGDVTDCVYVQSNWKLLAKNTEKSLKIIEFLPFLNGIVAYVASGVCWQRQGMNWSGAKHVKKRQTGIDVGCDGCVSRWNEMFWLEYETDSNVITKKAANYF